MADDYIPDAQGATVTFDGKTLGVLRSLSPVFSAGTVHEVTSHASPLTGSGQNARLLKQYNCTSIEPGTLQCRFLGTPDLARNDIGGPQMLSFSWSGGTVSGQAICTELQAEIAYGDLVQWAATFQFTGF